jgi:endonuclease YncB( thermonuclease family)
MPNHAAKHSMLVCINLLSEWLVAPHYAKEQTPERRVQYEFPEFEAKAKKAGLWKEPEPVSPREWRFRHLKTVR